MSDFLKVLNERASAEHFDPTTSISVQEIKELISEACQAPSSFNIQHWRFIAVTDERIRERLKGTTIAPNQEHRSEHGDGTPELNIEKDLLRVCLDRKEPHARGVVPARLITRKGQH
jgi:nitroreductase